MADYVAILKKALGKHGDETPEKRTRIYASVRTMLAKKLEEYSPPPAAEAIATQMRSLEDAIASVERDYAKSLPETDPLAELEHIFSSIDRNKNQPSHTRQPAKAESAWPAPPAAKPESYQPAPPPAAKVEPSWQRATPAPSQPARADTPLPGMDADEAEDEADVFSSDEEPVSDTFQRLRPAERKRSYGGLIAAVVALLVVAGGGYGIWLNKDAFGKMLGLGGNQVAKTEPVKPAPAKPATDAAATPPAPAAGGTEAESTKFTQRLTPQGSEVDPGPAGGQSGIGEGESVAALTTPPSATNAPAISAPAAGTPAAAAPPATGAAPATPPANGAAPAAPPDAAGTPPAPAAAPAETALPVGQKAIFYEERTSTAQGSAEPGNIVWSLVQESPGGDLPPEPAIRAEATIPGKDIQLRMTIRRNTDQTLPASHIIEMIFLTPDGFEGGGVDNILRVAMKGSEQDAGSPLIGIPAKIADGFFLVALNDTKADEDANMTLLRGQDWIDVPVVYKTGRRALLTMEKGIPGEKVFDEAIKAWQAKTAG
ncbi:MULTISPECIES: hypothetical protein [Mesorhizobium]|uniref:hypothetical protein n=2 Tax=Phyllobacteriaceae TaxID=69277 RepID=UPI000FCC9FBF|nr:MULTISPECIES: hypothetical protein [Mesorhizobium]RWN88720.1 MAG: hypothetical protein EOS05_30325 [Mesorhizobium sp.]MCF6125584.1 hypothetical protein [Mesorhizobium ciceri]MCQ8816085.1 hypothetical protein [Mesorhizobium sp. SEMIA396]RUX69294.1 hypothetical protein EN983_27845 [Mesorhizobium sp. M7A.F.Ca.CA.004.08.2.1]RUX89016.1 hypothetical protein EN982_04085 [Mesorhizobium sp. M7A.F.Ca.CA.004.08.1.1]